MNILFAVIVLGVLGAVFGLVLAVASKIFEVKKDPREEAILSHLAGANCGGCGYPGCGGCAAAILAGDAPVTACAPAGAENAAAIAEIMGMAAPTGEREVAFVRCTGGINAKKRYDYVGVKDCISATKVAGSPLECAFGCLGFLLAIVLFASIRERLVFADYPKSFDGFPIALVTAGLMALAFMGFSGLRIW